MGLGSVLRSTWRDAMVLLVLFLLGGGSLVWITAISYGTLFFVLVGVIISGLVVSRLRSADTDGDSNSVWDAIPSRQYDGRHAESGGLSRGEQEQALQEIQQDAEQRNENIPRRK